MNTEEYLQKFGKDYHFRLEPKTLKDYQYNVKELVKFTEKAFDAITKRDIWNWLTYMTENGYKPSSIRYKLIGLKTFFKYCWEEDLISQNPAAGIPFPRVGESLPRYVTLEQLTQLRQLVEGKLSERAMIEVLYATGARFGELAEMMKSDVNWSERSILITKGKFKKERIVLFTPKCAEYLKAYLDSRKDNLPYLFINTQANMSIRPVTTYKTFRFYSKQLGFKVTPHMLRHTFAAHLAQKGMPFEAIQDLLGHDSPHTTQLYARLYEHARKEMYDEWM